MPLPALQLTYRGPGWIGNTWRDVVCHAGERGYELEVAGAGRFTISSDGKAIYQLAAAEGASPQLTGETLLGPCLILALALQGTWCLHASAARCRGRLVAFAGESGVGKSTLAAYLAKQAGPEWRRAVDDILPVAPTPTGLEARPHFPQLKLPYDAQPWTDQPERLPLTALFLLQGPQGAGPGVDIRPVSRKAAGLALVRHTVASRLFDKPLLARHLAFCSAAAESLPVFTVSYPHQFSLLPQVRDRLAAILEDLYPTM